MVTLDLLVLAVYLLGILMVGLWAQRKATTQEDFLVAGRSVGPVLYSGTMAAIMSTSSACLLASSTVLLEDVYLPVRQSESVGSVTQSRILTLVLGIAATLIACLTVDVIAALTVAYDLLVGGLLVPVLGAILWRRGTAPAALASIAVGGAAVVALLFAKGIDSDVPIYGGLGLSLAVYLGISGFSASEDLQHQRR